jgi:hypothetical protein
LTFSDAGTGPSLFNKKEFMKKLCKKRKTKCITKKENMKYPCENCKLRAAYEKNPKSFVGRFWRWQINFCPSWHGYFKSLPPEKQEELRKKYDFWKYQQ